MLDNLIQVKVEETLPPAAGNVPVSDDGTGTVSTSQEKMPEESPESTEDTPLEALENPEITEVPETSQETTSQPPYDVTPVLS